MQPQLKSAKAFISLLLVIFMMFSAMSVGVSAYAVTERFYSVPDVRYNSSSAASSEVVTELLEDYLRSELLKTSEIIDISKYNISDEYAEPLCNYIYDCMPEMFHVVGIQYGVRMNKITMLVPSYSCSASEYSALYNKCVLSADKLLDGIKDNAELSDVEKALLIHDRLAVLCEYDSKNLEAGSVPNESYTMYGALVEGVAVCQGYSEAYMYLLNEVGISSYLCDSASLNHVWNIIAIDGREYHVDVTWDDPANDITGRVLHTNFLRSSAGIYSAGHNAKDYITTPVSTTYDNYFWQNSEAEFQLLGNEIYYIDSKAEQIKKYSDKSAVKSVADIWYAGSDGVYYVGNFSRLSSDGTALYYNNSTSVFRYDPVTDTETKVWTPVASGEYFRIYGFTFTDNVMYCDLNDSPNFTTVTKDKYQQQQDLNIKSVLIKTKPEKTEYYIGDSFDPKGLSLTVYYRNGSQQTITSGYSVSFDSTKTGRVYVQISYGNRSDGFFVNVNSPSIQISETELHVNNGESKELTATTIPAGQTVTWFTDNDCVSVSQNGTVTGVSNGNAVIIAQFIFNGYVYSADCNAESGCLHTTRITHEARESTCTEHGHDTYTECTDCGDILSGSAEQFPLLPHDYTDVEEERYIAQAATCTTAAVYYKSCSVCGEASVSLTFISDTYAPHEEEILPAKEATCTQTGLTIGSRCSVCMQIMKPQQVIEKTGHIMTVIPGKAPTENETGLTEGLKCSVCKEIFVEQEEIPRLEHEHKHDFNVTVTEPTCTVNGLRTYTCICGETYSQQISATGHSPVIIPGRPATETQTGLSDGKKCSVCDEILVAQTEIPVIAPEHKHDFVSVVTAPTCTADGFTTYICSCGEEYTANPLPATGHKPEIIPGKEPTETETGLTDGEKCSVCSEILKAQEDIPVSGHILETIKGKAPTCTENGLTDGTVCTTCGNIVHVQEIIPAKGHTVVTIHGKPATETEDGLTDGEKCSVCSEILKEQEIIPAVGHTTVIIPGKEPTCTKTGLTEGKICTVCGAVVQAQEIIPVKSHEYELITVKAPSCTENGAAIYRCMICGYTSEADEIPAKGHDITSVVTNPTCTEKGFTTCTCAVCGFTYTDAETEATGHEKGDWKVEKEPQTGKEGLEVQRCSVCGEKLSERVIPALKDNTPDKLEVHDDTVTVDGDRNISTVRIKTKAGDIAKSIENENFAIVDKNGIEIPDKEYIGTGSKIQIKDNDGNVINEYAVCVPNDVDGNGKTTAADARLALRGSAKLENIEGVYAMASDVNGDGKITAADARKILRVSAGLEKP